jgi:hypothetical protein
MGTAVMASMQSHLRGQLDREAVSRALIHLVADAAWADRDQPRASAPHPQRDEAMSLLPKVQLGDHEATKRAVELVNAVRRVAP